MSTAAESQIGAPSMDMLTGDKLAEARLTDWRKLAQGLMPATGSRASAPAHGSWPRSAKRATRSDTTRACRSATGTSTSS